MAVGFDWTDELARKMREFGTLLNNNDFDGVFNDKYFEGVEKRKDALEHRSQTVQTFQVTMVLILAIALLSVRLRVSIFGLSVDDVRNVREIMLLVLASVQMASIFKVIEERNLRRILEAYVEKISRGNDAAKMALRLRYGLDSGFVVARATGETQYTWRHIVTLAAAGVGILGWLAIYFLCAFAIEIWGLISIVRDPTVSVAMSLVVVVYVVLAAVTALGVNKIAGTFKIEKLT